VLAVGAVGPADAVGRFAASGTVGTPYQRLMQRAFTLHQRYLDLSDALVSATEEAQGGLHTLQ